MIDLVKEIGNFVMQHIGVEGTGILLMAAALIYIWFQHHRSKLLEERLSLTEEKRAALARELEQLSKSATTQEQPPPRALVDRETTGIPRVVLIADDEKMMRELLAHFIKAQFKGVSIVFASDGEETLQHINRHPPWLLILDLMMPRKTGYEVLKELSNRIERFPILVISAYASSKEQVAAQGQIGSDRIEFLTKPFSVEEMVGMIQKMLSQQDVR